MKLKNKLSAIAVFAAISMAAASKTTAQEIETITVTESRDKQTLSQISRSISVFNQSDIAQVQVDHVQQLLNQTSGVNLHRNSGQEMLIALRSPVLTGAGACGNFLTLENGIALRPNGFCNVNELFESHYELAESIEVVKGPTSAFYGSSGLHGAINIINPASLERTPFVKTSIGEWDYQQLSFLANTDSLAISSSLSHSGGFRDDSGFDQQKLSVTHKYQSDAVEINTFATATNLNQETAGYLVGLNNYKDETLSRTNANPEAYRDASSLRVSQEYRFNSGLIIRPYVRYSEMEFLQHFVPGKPVETNEHRSFGLQSQYRYQISPQTTLDVGMDAELADIELVEEQFVPTQGSNFLIATIPQGKHYDYQVDAQTLAAFASMQHQLTDTWTFNAGLRIENIDLDYNNRMNSGRVDENGDTCGFGGCRFNRPESRTDDFAVASPKLGFVYNGAGNNAYLNLSHGYRAPQATELYRLQRAQQVSDLDPEQIIALDGGYSTNINNVEVKLEAYFYQKSDVILRDSDFFYISGGETDHKGIEFSFSTPISESLKLKGNTSYSKHSYENNPNLSSQDIIGNEIVSAPNLLANLSAEYQLENWSIHLRGQFVDDYYLNAENTSTYEGHTLLHARAEYKYSDQLSIAMNVDNLLDQRYAERANYTSFTEERYFPGKPRNIKVAVTYQF